MTALATHAPRPLRPTAGQAIWAVIGGSIFAWACTLVMMIPLFVIGLPMPFNDETTGMGWPWRIDGPWSFAADAGPLLVSGFVFAWGVDAFLSRHTGITAPRTPLAPTAIIVGWVTVNGASNAGFVGFNGLVAFTTLVVVARLLATRERKPWRWSRMKAVLALIVGVGLAGATVSYGFLHPLTAGSSQLITTMDGRAAISVSFWNEGRADARLLEVTVPGLPTRARIYNGGSATLEEWDTVMDPVAGTVIRGEGSTHDVELTLPNRCLPPRLVDRVDVRMRVHGRTVRQVVRLDPPVYARCR